MKWVSVILLVGCVTARGAVVVRDGEALMPVVVAVDASESLQESAGQLADMLGRIGKARVDVETAETLPSAGIVLRVVDDSYRPEHYSIASTDEGVQIVGGSDLAVQHAVWDLLYRLGHRQYFPSDVWEIVPQLSVIDVDVNCDEEPDYRSRHIWYAGRPDSWSADSYDRWIARNRMGGAFDLSTGHAWQSIVDRHSVQFAEHPEWLALIDGQRVTPDGLEKFCVSNADLRQLVVEDVLAQARANPRLDSISLDPSDGLGWCECDACRAIGGPSDRVVLLANQAAAALEEAGYDRMHIGHYAYAGHSYAPHIEPHPKVIVCVATAFSDRTPDEIIAGWKQAGVRQFGIREYHSVYPWDHDLPGASRASNIDYLKTTIPGFHEQGARFYTSETDNSWGPSGLGHFLSARLLWDVAEADHLEELTARFINDCFGDAAEPMTEFYARIDGSNKPLMSEDLIGRMYRLLTQAKQQAADPAVHARLDDLTLFTRYVELYDAYRQGSPEDAVTAIRFAWRIRKTGMVHTMSIYRDLPHRDARIVVPDNAAWSVPEGKNPWKPTEPVTSDEIARLLVDGVANNSLFDFEPRQFGGVLGLAGLKRGSAEFGDFGPYDRNEQSWWVWMPQPGTFSFDALTGVIPSYRDVRDTTFELHTYGQPIDHRVGEASVPPDGETHAILLTSTLHGLHRLTHADAGAMTNMTFPETAVITREASTQSPLSLSAGARVYFYVPPGTTTIGGFSETEQPRVFPADAVWEDGTSVGPGYFAVAVPPGKDGMCWRLDVRSSRGNVILMTVPPWVARSPDQLLLPSDVDID